jgi:hypothetical protein
MQKDKKSFLLYNIDNVLVLMLVMYLINIIAKTIWQHKQEDVKAYKKRLKIINKLKKRGKKIKEDKEKVELDFLTRFMLKVNRTIAWYGMLNIINIAYI